MFAYRYDSDDLCNYDRYKFSYVAQFGYSIEGDTTNTAAVRIYLPRDPKGNLRDCDSVTYMVYAEYRVVLEERAIYIDKLEVINFTDKLRVMSLTDHVVEFFKDEVLRDRHALDFYSRPNKKVATSVWDDVGPPININDIDYTIKIQELSVSDREVDYTETDMRKLTLEWFAPDPDTNLDFV